MLFTIFQWVPAVLMVGGLFFLALRPILLKTLDKKRPLRARTKSVLWFMQALGFWGIVIGSWMRFENLIVELLDGDEDDTEESAPTTPSEKPAAEPAGSKPDDE